MKTRTINEEGKALCMCSEGDQKALRENKGKCTMLINNGTWAERYVDTLLSPSCVYKLKIEEPETRREWLGTLPVAYSNLAIRRIEDAGNMEHLDDPCEDLGEAVGNGTEEAFSWIESPEGVQFWDKVANGKLPPIAEASQAEPEMVPEEDDKQLVVLERILALLEETMKRKGGE